MSTPPLDTSHIAIAADIADAVDVTSTPERRIAAAHRAADRDPHVAMAMATQFAYGLLAGACERDPSRSADDLMRELRIRLSQVGA